MIGKNEWKIAYRDVVARGRARAGGPPAAAELEAYSRGELSPEETVRIRELLTYYPDLASALTESSPPELSSAELAALSDEIVANDWESLGRRLNMAAPSPAPAPFVTARAPLWSWAVAASIVAVVFGGLYINSRSTIQHLQRELHLPRINVEQILLSQEGWRGGKGPNPVKLEPTTQNVVIVLTLVDETRFDDYRIDLVDLASSPTTVIWSTSGLSRRRDGTFAIELPKSFLQHGKYRLLLYAGSNRDRPVATYRLTVSPD